MQGRRSMPFELTLVKLTRAALTGMLWLSESDLPCRRPPVVRGRRHFLSVSGRFPALRRDFSSLACRAFPQ